MRPWHFGNTTVRSPFRLKDGLDALARSDLLGNLRGVDADKKFRDLLGAAGLVKLGDDSTNSVGRKWRSALEKLGFLYPKVKEAWKFRQEELGTEDTITPNGKRLVAAASVPAIQECFLRALAAVYIPSPQEKSYSFPVFSPLRHTLRVMLALERAGETSRINFIEMALVVQLTSSQDSIHSIVEQILSLRNSRIASVSKPRFDRLAYREAAQKHKYIATTFVDYADLNFRYLKSTNLVLSKGRGLTVNPEKRVFVEQLVADTTTPANPHNYLRVLCRGASLPTDDVATGRIVLDDLLEQAAARGVPVVASGPLDTAADINLVRHDIEDKFRVLNEIDYANRQADEWEEIAAYMELLTTRRRSLAFRDGDIEIPHSEAPAYFEWVLWRAFLAIDSLVVPPDKTRGFQIDQDFLPVGVAKGGAPDLTFEFEDFILIVEVTFTENSRQEAAEGEPVRRHVADVAAANNKPVYCLFIANTIDINTANTFLSGTWYVGEDKMSLNIVPLTVEQFRSFFISLFRSENIDVGLVRELLDTCVRLRDDCEAPEWRRRIASAIDERAAAL